MSAFFFRKFEVRDVFFFVINIHANNLIRLLYNSLIKYKLCFH